jgi:peptide/nickel transport system substrate-binding protein
MLQLKLTLSLLKAFWARFKKIILAAAFGGVLVFLFWHYLSPLFPGFNQKTIGLTGKFRLDNLPDFILAQVSQGLTKYAPDGQPKPDLAESWQGADSGKTWTFTLKKNLFWQDKKPITSQDLNYTFSDALVEKPNPEQIVFKLKNAFSPFPGVVSRPVFKKGFLGSGLWRLKKITLSGNNLEKLTLIHTQNRERLIYKFFSTEERAKLGFKLGEVDQLTGIINPAPLDAWKNVMVTGKVDTQRYVAVFLNSAKGKLTADKNLRQALNYATNKNTLGEKRALGPISPESWAFNSQVKPYDFDREHAQELLKNLSKETRDNLKLNLATTPVLLPVAEKIARNWQAIGVKTEIKVSPAPTESEFDALLIIVEIPLDPDQYALWHSSQTSNIARYQNQRIDKLLEDGRIETNLETRRKIYLDFQRFLVEDSPAIFLYHPVTYTISRD